MTNRAVVIGLDGVAWHLLEPLFEQGVMPRLQALRGRGAWGTLTSTIPTYTPPAWTSAITGVNPGRHGIYGFHSSNAQSERVELMHSGKVRSATIWEMANAQGASAGIFNVPLTYPPQPVENGWMVSGMMTPGHVEGLRGFASSRELEEKILEWVPDYELEIKTSWELDWRDDSLSKRAIKSLEQRRTVLERLLTERPVDVLFTVMETPDRVQHAYYRYMDPADSLYDSEAGRAIRPTIHRFFAVLDEIVGLLEDYAGEGGVIVCSDHGFTAWEFTVHTNALLAEWGYLKLKPRARLMQTAAARALIPVAKRVLSTTKAREAKAKTFSAIDWSKTKAFASPIPQQGIFINLKGRERFGIVDENELDAVKSDLVARFKALRAPDGAPVTDEVHRAEEVFKGDALQGAPDVLPVLRNHRYDLSDEVFHKEAFTDNSHLPRGVHHPDGIVVYAGAGVRQTSEAAGSVMDVTPTLLYMAGLAVPEGLDGEVATRVYDSEHLAAHPIATTTATGHQQHDDGSPYSEEEEAAIEESLRGLGYI